MAVRSEVVWLDGKSATDPAVIGARGATISRLHAAHLPAPRGFVVPSWVFERIAGGVILEEGGQLNLPDELAALISASLRRLGGPVAVRRSPLGHEPEIKGLLHEPFLNLVHQTDVLEAVRRLWLPALRAAQPTAVLIQRYVLPDACAMVRERDAGTLSIEATYGAGDLLAAGLVVPDRLTVTTSTGETQAQRIGRKAQMSIPRADGGLVRVPVPASSACEAVLAPEMVARLAALWRSTSDALGPLSSLSASISGKDASITSAIIRLPVANPA
jgi:phosphoenolpyruvate synthase/pyruvate phosphate dikinase